MNSPFQIANPNPDLYCFVAQHQAIVDQLLLNAAKDREIWIRTALAPIVPPAILRAVDALKYMNYVTRWLARNGFSMEVRPFETRLLQHGSTIATYPKGWSNVINRWTNEPRPGTIVTDWPTSDELKQLYGTT